MAILFICNSLSQSALEMKKIVPVLLATLFLTDISYIASCNVRDNSILFLFCGLLCVDSWYLLSVSNIMIGANTLFLLLSPILMLVSIQFCFLFLFQGYKYKYKKVTNILLVILCIGTIVSIPVSKRVFACLFGIQFIISILWFSVLVLYHWKRIKFFIKSERQSILISLSVTAIAFLFYYSMTKNITNHISNF